MRHCMQPPNSRAQLSTRPHANVNSFIIENLLWVPVYSSCCWRLTLCCIQRTLVRRSTIPIRKSPVPGGRLWIDSNTTSGRTKKQYSFFIWIAWNNLNNTSHFSDVVPVTDGPYNSELQRAISDIAKAPGILEKVAKKHFITIEWGHIVSGTVRCSNPLFAIRVNIFLSPDHENLKTFCTT